MRPGGAPALRNDSDIRIDEIRVHDLHAFALSTLSEARGDDPIPLPPQRALAYSRNPYASGTDIGMLIASSRGRCAGYLGIMPGRLLKDGALHPVHWFSTWFVPPEFRDAGVGIRLLQRAMALRYDLAVTGTSAEADRVYRGLGFREIGPLRYVKLTVPGPAAMRKALWDLMLRRHASLIMKVTVREVSRLPEHLDRAPEAIPGPPRFYRGVPVVNWMLADPWILEGDDGGMGVRYAFSHTRGRFRFIAMETGGASAAGPPGYLVVSVSTESGRTVLKVLDFSAASDAEFCLVFALALRYASRHRADQVDLPQEVCRAAGPGIVPRLLLRKGERVCFCHPRDAESPLAGALESVRLSYCDGDMAFV